jgi:UDPglucose 6-dehydrogenase
MKVCVYGLWHLGIVTVAGLSKIGHTVVGLDSFDLHPLSEGILPLYEPDISDSIIEGVNNNKITFENDPVVALSGADVVWVTFDTPVDSNGNVDIKFIESKIISILNYVEDGTKLIISSQVRVGFTKKIEKIILKNYPYKKIYIAYSPENLRLGRALEIFINPDRIVIGVNYEDIDKFDAFFKSISWNLIWMSIPSAEMTKHAINVFLSMSICFANEIARICDSVGASSDEVEIGLKTDHRIGYKSYTRSGNAYSGGTLERDVKCLSDVASRSFVTTPILSSISDSNDYHKIWIQSKCLDVMNNKLKDRVVMVFGLTYKEGTSTLRKSGSLEFCEWLNKEGCIIYAYDDLIKSHNSEIPDYINIVNNPFSVDFECAVILKDICVFDNDLLREKIIIDPNGYLFFKDIDGLRYFSVRRNI